MNKENMSYSEFLDTVKVLKMLFGRDIAEKYFTNNINLFYDVDSESFSKKKG